MRIAIFVFTVVAVLAAAGAQAQSPVAPNEVRLCEHENYQGKCVSFFLKPHMRHRLVRQLPATLDNQVSSMQVGSDVKIFGFSDRDFMGPSHEFWTAHPDLQYKLRYCMDYHQKERWPDRISSLIIVPRDDGFPDPEPSGHPVTAVEGVYLQANPPKGQLGALCREGYYPFPENRAVKEARFPNLGPYMDNRADEVAVCGHLAVELYPEPRFKGTPVIMRTGQPSNIYSSDFWWRLDDFGINNDVSSLISRPMGGKVEVGQAPPLLPPERGGEAAGEPHRAPPVVQPMTAQPIQTSFEHGIDRAGGDYQNFDLPEPRPELCRDACIADSKCRAYTYVKPGIQGAKARCWLKSTVGPARPDGCCVSGVKP